MSADECDAIQKKLLVILSKHISSLLSSAMHSDMVVVIGEKKFELHKAILAARSEYFKALLGEDESAKPEINLQDVQIEAFEIVLKYIYSGCLTLTEDNEELLRNVLSLAYRFSITDLKEFLNNKFKKIIVMKNVVDIINSANSYNNKQLLDMCCAFIDSHISDFLKDNSFVKLSMESMAYVIKRDSFFVPELEIFEAVSKWVKENEIGSVFEYVRFSLLQPTDIFRIVRPSKLISDSTLLDALEDILTDKPLPFRGKLILDENLALSNKGSKVLTGLGPQNLLDDNIKDYDGGKGYTWHDMNAEKGGVTVELSHPCIVNNIRVLLWDLDTRSYSYYISVSMNNKQWDTVVDYSKYLCRSWQDLYFQSRVIKYIKIVGKHNTANESFHIVELQAFYKSSIPKLVDDFVIPSDNVASLEKKAAVVGGISLPANKILNGNITDYDGSQGFTYHTISHEPIIIQLAQPYVISSMRILLWDKDDRHYKYYIESSLDKSQWEIIVDNKNKECKSWQVAHFPPKPMLFIKIVGTFNTANDGFHCVHFECPTQYDTNNKLIKHRSNEDIQLCDGDINLNPLENSNDQITK